MPIQILEMPQGHPSELGGPLALPAGFDTTRFAAKWVKEGNAVAAAQEREFLLGTKNLTADGWQPWHDGDSPSRGKLYKVALQSGTYVLMYRDRGVQDDVNAIYGNVGKERQIAEQSGQTSAGVPLTDPGVLSDEKLAPIMGPMENEPGEVKMNPVRNVEYVRVERETLETSNAG